MEAGKPFKAINSLIKQLYRVGAFGFHIRRILEKKLGLSQEDNIQGQPLRTCNDLSSNDVFLIFTAELRKACAMGKMS